MRNQNYALVKEANVITESLYLNKCSNHIVQAHIQLLFLIKVVSIKDIHLEKNIKSI